MPLLPMGPVSTVFHSLSPQAVFANIAPPSLEPAYALQCSAFSWYKEFTTQLPNADCFHRCLLNSVLAPSCLVAAMQRRLVCVWQTYIGRWHEGASLTRYRLTFKQPPPAWYRAPPRQMNCNGHVLRACPRSEGVFCVKCGRTQKQWKQRWKITRLPCRLRHTPESQWLSEPNFHHNANRGPSERCRCLLP